MREARKDFRRELKNHPDESYVSYLYAVALGRSGQIEKAEAVLKAVVKGHPGDLQSVEYLVALEAKQGKNDLPGEVEILKHSLKVKPDNAGLTDALAQDLIRNHQNGEAAQLLEKSLKTTTDNGTLNNYSYDLARTGKGLALAEKKSREAVKELEAQAETEPVEKANGKTFLRALYLSSYWDTQGYIQ